MTKVHRSPLASFPIDVDGRGSCGGGGSCDGGGISCFGSASAFAISIFVSTPSLSSRRHHYLLYPCHKLQKMNGHWAIRGFRQYHPPYKILWTTM